MSTNSQDQEIDLGQVFSKIGGFFSTIFDTFFDFIFFLKKKSLFIGILLIFGFIFGYYLDKKSKTYNHEIIVSPNFGSVDYLYSKIELIKSKIKEDDKKFIKTIGINNSNKIINIEVEPIIDIYTLVNSNTIIDGSTKNSQNFELIKLMSENEDINKIIKDEKTSKNYPHHKILITTNNKIENDEVVKQILKYLNTDEYLNKLLTITKENTLIKIKKNEEQIFQIDKLINQISVNLSKEKNTSNLVYNNENSEINDLFSLKNSLINEIAAQKINLENIKFCIKDISIITNLIKSEGLNNKMKFVLPLFLIFVYLLFFGFISLYKKQLLKREQQ
ncbi:hypothetical protein NAT47_03465 [Flavobacterium sp. HXWNR69]|jgi:hypothetical protein|uniref:Chain length determinant protein n=1 Tax=Flavobacterium fragile TaxID=2949085 RepID=A0ABT0TER4_9FLAO|nr:hypothetical protein [Flavobacterium sp. HXWNR69]MCL9769466.1 hypothetical protein [Flavobacterium sp. HXWNR69]